MICVESKTQVRSGQVAGQVRSGHRSDQVNRKNIFLVRKLTIFNSKLTRYEKESIIMHGIVYFKLQDVTLRDLIRSNRTKTTNFTCKLLPTLLSSASLFISSISVIFNHVLTR